MSTRTSSDIFTNLSTLLPTGTFLTFQSLAPLFTNNGVCGRTEKVVTGILLGLFFFMCFSLSFVDSVTTVTGKVTYGVVTPWGLYNPAFKKLKIPDDDQHHDSLFTGGKKYHGQYMLHYTDFINGVLNVITFGALSCLTPPISTCYYPDIPPTVVKTGPILAAIVVGTLFAMFPSGRNGLGYSKTEEGIGLVTNTAAPEATPANGSADATKPPADGGNGGAPTNVDGSGKKVPKGAGHDRHELEGVL